LKYEPAARTRISSILPGLGQWARITPAGVYAVTINLLGLETNIPSISFLRVSPLLEQFLDLFSVKLVDYISLYLQGLGKLPSCSRGV